MRSSTTFVLRSQAQGATPSRGSSHCGTAAARRRQPSELKAQEAVARAACSGMATSAGVTSGAPAGAADVAALTQLLKQHWGTAEFRDRQLDAVVADLEGRDLFVSLPTGAGKSLCFQLPAVAASANAAKPGAVTVVLVPLLALATDQGEVQTPNPRRPHTRCCLRGSLLLSLRLFVVGISRCCSSRLRGEGPARRSLALQRERHAPSEDHARPALRRALHSASLHDAGERQGKDFLFGSATTA